MGLVWDYSAGFVIDTSTGEVVDRIFDYSLPRTGDGVLVRPGTVFGKRFLSKGAAKKRMHYRRKQQVMRMYSEIADYLMRQGVYDEVMGILDYLMTNTHYTGGMQAHSKLLLAYMVYLLRHGITPYYYMFRRWISYSQYRRLKKKAAKILGGE